LRIGVVEGVKAQVMKSKQQLHDIIIVEMVADGEDAFVVVAGIKIAKRSLSEIPQARTWVSLQPSWKVFDGDGMSSIAVECNGARLSSSALRPAMLAFNAQLAREIAPLDEERFVGLLDFSKKADAQVQAADRKEQ
jgi:hypothetical protein